jgi:hypothetical protein
MKMSRNAFYCNKLIWSGIFLVCCYLLCPAPSAAGENSLFYLANGLEIRLYSPEAIMRMTDRDQDGRLFLKLPDGTCYELIESAVDPRIANAGDGSFHPAKIEWVIDALAKVDVAGASIDMRVDVYVLPLPRAGFLESSACGDKIFLSPGVREIERCLVAFAATHELGHVFQCRYAPEGSGGPWTEYLRLRGIAGNAVYALDVPRANRPAEIFAEDFRYLFGGSESRYTGGIENQELPLPDDVPGLEEYFAALVAPVSLAQAARPGEAPFALSNYPNPFNPTTTIRAVFNGQAPADAGGIGVSIYRVDGSLVRRVTGGAISGNEFSVRWDGRDERGNAAPAGVYFYAVRAAGIGSTGKMILAR